LKLSGLIPNLHFKNRVGKVNAKAQSVVAVAGLLFRDRRAQVIRRNWQRKLSSLLMEQSFHK
jgi:hypothetical protein